MEITDKKLHVLSHIKVDVTSQDLAQKIQTSGNSPGIFKIAEKTVDKVKGIWKPMAIYQWFEFETIGKDNSGRITQSSGSHVDFDFGHSFHLLQHARHALISVYTAGPELEKESNNASSKGNLLEAYFLDLIGLIVLEKVGKTIKKTAEKHAEDLGWGVSPFLSPGSVHGWDLKEQIKLCSLLPLEKINVKIREDAVLSPFKTISCLIGSGPGYDAVQVGTTCQVCSKNHECPMKQNIIAD
ncbi:MAG: hypothetical protein KAJ62_07205 [Desulfobacteraceae bacterium]|nr:hypothetical protein [Desulfobacteraceae bacterium]